mmetsp:Transcript_29130/g.62874  ORF Transcript_29130/g.62874 Transcript_29130/m.62874 type:complete len:174 (+) Transcript_29130:99-620(+)
MWVKECYGEQAIKDIQGAGISCSGVTLGTTRAVHAYLTTLTNEFLRLRHAVPWNPWCFDKNGMDQGVHNWLVFTNRVKHKWKGHRNDHGAVKTVGSSRTYRNRIGQVVNRDGRVPAIVHQYDRIPELNTLVSQMFPFTSDAPMLQPPIPGHNQWNNTTANATPPTHNDNSSIN